MIYSLLKKIIQKLINIPGLYDRFELVDSPSAGPAIILRPRVKSSASLNQNDNASHPDGLGKRKRPYRGKEQCAVTAHARVFLAAVDAAEIRLSMDPEKIVKFEIIDQSKVFDSGYAKFLNYMDWSDCRAAKTLYSWIGIPTSSNSNFCALKSILETFGLPLLAVDRGSAEGADYINGLPRLREYPHQGQDALKPDQVKKIFVEIWQSLRPLDQVVSLVKPFPSGHYVGIIDVDETGIEIDDPYGIMHPNKSGYKMIHGKNRVAGSRYRLTWKQCAMSFHAPHARICIFRFSDQAYKNFRRK